MQLIQLLGDSRDRLACLALRRRHACCPAAAPPSRSSRSMPDAPPGARAAAARRAPDRRLDLLEPAARADRWARRIDPAAPPAPDGRPRRQHERGAERDRARDALRRDARRGGRPRSACGRPVGARSRPPKPTSARPSSSSRRSPDGAAPPRPLPRADEHLRRPRQHPLPAAALRVAGHRLRPTQPPVPASASTPAPTTSSTSAAARTATSAPSPPTWSRASARRWPRRPRTAPSCSPSAAATSCSATATSSARSACPGLGLVDLETVRSPGPRLIGNVAIEVDLGGGPQTVAGFENHGGRTHLGPGAAAARPGAQGLRQQRRGRLRGRPPRQPDRHLPARPAAAQERLAGRPPDRPGPGAPLRRAARSWSRSTTASSAPPTKCPAPRFVEGFGSQPQKLRGGAQRPLEPKPPSPRAESARASASTGSARAIGVITSWAMRSPGSTRKISAGSVLSSSTRISPR